MGQACVNLRWTRKAKIEERKAHTTQTMMP